MHHREMDDKYVFSYTFIFLKYKLQKTGARKFV